MSTSPLSSLNHEAQHDVLIPTSEDKDHELTVRTVG